MDIQIDSIRHQCLHSGCWMLEDNKVGRDCEEILEELDRNSVPDYILVRLAAYILNPDIYGRISENN